MLLDVRDLKCHFEGQGQDVRAVDGVSFTVDEAEIVCLVGESGSGKSVTAQAIMRIVPSPPARPLQGEVFFEGVDLLGLTEAEMRRLRGSGIAMVFQEPQRAMNPVLTVGRQISEVIRLHLGLSVRESEAKAKELLGKVQISDPEQRFYEFPHQFSGGMLQRVTIATAIASEPRLIIADEPTTALDVTVQAQVLDLLATRALEANAALLLITHDLSLVARYADRVFVMYAGRIVEHGTAEQLFNRPSHPYTMGLLRSIPRLDADPEVSLQPIGGRPPDLSDLPSGCSFHPRCQYAFDRCERDEPVTLLVEQGHGSACWLATEAASDYRSKRSLS